jgi:OOP family OmpA-OmpF porin
MRPGKHRVLALLTAASLASAVPLQQAPAQTAPAATPPPAAQTPSLVDQFIGPESPASAIDVLALRQKAADRIQSRADAPPLRRPPVAPELGQFPHFDFNVVFDPDTAVIRPQSYQLIGRIADALSDPRLRPYGFLVISHTESTGSRAANLTLSQRRADAIRSALVGSFRISARHLQALGLGEEQLHDGARPTHPANARTQIINLGVVPEVEPAAASTPAAKKGKAKKRQ